MVALGPAMVETTVVVVPETSDSERDGRPAPKMVDAVLPDPMTVSVTVSVSVAVVGTAPTVRVAVTVEVVVFPPANSVLVAERV